MKQICILIIVIVSATNHLLSQNCNLISNGNFESPVITISPTFYTSPQMSGWQTIAPDGKMELWLSGFYGFSSFSGGQHLEIDAFYNSTVFQNITVSPGSQLAISFAHRGRMGVDTMSVLAGPVGGPYSTLGIFADDTVAWGYYTVNYLVPNLGTNYSIRFNPIYGTGIIQGYGNFLDSVSVCATNVGMNEIAQNGNSVSVFPSLFTDELNVTYKGKESLQFILYDLSTRTVLNQFITGSTSLNTHQLAKGIYLYELRNENGLIKKEKVIKE